MLPRALTDAGRARQYWERHAQNYDRSMRILGRPMPRVLELTSAAVAGSGSVLEVAAGSGLITLAIAPSVKRLIATDYAEAMVSLLRERVATAGMSNVECSRADIYALPYEPCSFDAVVAANVLHLVPDLPGAIRAMRRVLAPGGKLVVPTFCHDETSLSWLASRALAVTGFPGARRFTERSLRSALENEGVRVTRSEVIPGLLPIGYVEGFFCAEPDDDR